MSKRSIRKVREHNPVLSFSELVAAGQFGSTKEKGWSVYRKDQKAKVEGLDMPPGDEYYVAGQNKEEA